jgi:hypothetical protein
MISKFQHRGGLAPGWAVAPHEQKIIVVVNYVVLFKEVVRFSVCVCGIYIQQPA